jgi:NADH:ubiquinone oxidoreductase subunit 6 (subunit J)
MAEIIGFGSFILWGGIAIFASIIGIRVIFHKDIFHAGRLLTVSLIVMGASLFMTLPIVWYLAIVTAVFFIVSARVIVDQGKFLENIKF